LNLCELSSRYSLAKMSYTDCAISASSRLLGKISIMAQLSKDSFVVGGSLIPVNDAVGLLFTRVPCIDATESVDLIEADGRVLAQALAAPIDLPSFDNSAVDGYAVRFCDLSAKEESVLSIAGRVAAGHSLAMGDISGKAV